MMEEKYCWNRCRYMNVATARIPNPPPFSREIVQGPEGPVELLRVPDVRQDENYTCGPSSLQAVLGYYGEEHFEADLAEQSHADPEEGPPPANLAKTARELGFQAEIKEHLTLEDLEKSVKEGVPVIIAAQAWRDDNEKDKPWKEIWDSGHYMVVIGLDNKNVYFEDPSIFHSRGVIPRDEFLDRWHDIDYNQPCNNLGIFIHGKEPKPFPPTMHVD